MMQKKMLKNNQGERACLDEGELVRAVFLSGEIIPMQKPRAEAAYSRINYGRKILFLVIGHFFN